MNLRALKEDFVALTFDNRPIFYDLTSLDAIYRPEEIRLLLARERGREEVGETEKRGFIQVPRRRVDKSRAA